MTKHKQAKARKRAKQRQKEIKIHQHSFRSKPSASTALEHPRPLSKEEMLAQRKPIEEKEGDSGENQEEN